MLNLNTIIVKIERNTKHFNYLADMIISKLSVALMSNWGIVFFPVTSKINTKSKSKADSLSNDKLYK